MQAWVPNRCSIVILIPIPAACLRSSSLLPNYNFSLPTSCLFPQVVEGRGSPTKFSTLSIYQLFRRTNKSFAFNPMLRSLVASEKSKQRPHDFRSLYSRSIILRFSLLIRTDQSTFWCPEPPLQKRSTHI